MQIGGGGLPGVGGSCVNRVCSMISMAATPPVGASQGIGCDKNCDKLPLTRMKQGQTSG